MVLLGLGDGTFSSPIVLPVGESPHAIVTGDFFNNGHHRHRRGRRGFQRRRGLGRPRRRDVPARAAVSGRGRARRAGGRGPERRWLNGPGHGQSHVGRPDDPVEPAGRRIRDADPRVRRSRPLGPGGRRLQRRRPGRPGRRRRAGRRGQRPPEPRRRHFAPPSSFDVGARSTSSSPPRPSTAGTPVDLIASRPRLAGTFVLRLAGNGSLAGQRSRSRRASSRSARCSATSMAMASRTWPC